MEARIDDMLIQPLSKDVLYIFIIIATVLLPVAGGLGSLYLKRSLDRHGHGIDGAGTCRARRYRG